MNPYTKHDLIDPWFFIHKTNETDCPLIVPCKAVITFFKEWTEWDKTKIISDVITLLN